MTDNQQTALHSLSVKWRLHLDAKNSTIISPPLTFILQSKPAGPCRLRMKSHSLKRFLPFLLPPTLITESAGLVPRVMWKTLDRYPLTLHHVHACALGSTDIYIHFIGSFVAYICSYSSTERRSTAKLRRNSNIDTQGVSYSLLSMNY